jgi:hypothetical protein
MFVTKMVRCIYHEGVFNAMQIFPNVISFLSLQAKTLMCDQMSKFMNQHNINQLFKRPAAIAVLLLYSPA